MSNAASYASIRSSSFEPLPLPSKHPPHSQRLVVIVPMSDVHCQFEHTQRYMASHYYHYALLTEALIELSLKDIGTRYGLARAFEKAYTGNEGIPPSPTEPMFEYAEAMLERISETWQDHVLGDPSFVVYEAHRLPYQGTDTMMEIFYSERH